MSTVEGRTTDERSEDVVRRMTREERHAQHVATRVEMLAASQRTRRREHRNGRGTDGMSSKTTSQTYRVAPNRATSVSEELYLVQFVEELCS